MEPLILAAALLMAGPDVCADAQSCPTEGELVEALNLYGNGLASEQMRKAEKRGEIMVVHPRPAVRVGEVMCGRGRPAVSGSIVCRFPVYYHDNVDLRHVTARLVRGNGRWTIREQLTI